LPEPDVLRFIRAVFPSVWALELLRFVRQDRGRSLSHAEMVAGLRGSELVVTQSVQALASAGLVQVEDDGGARDAPASSELDRLADAALRLYASRPGKVRRAIVAAANPDLAAFADAFRLRKEPEE
jgi:hypothetical protein